MIWIIKKLSRKEIVRDLMPQINIPFFFFLATLAAVTLFSCGKSTNSPPDVSGITIHVDLIRTEIALAAVETKADLKFFLKKHPLFCEEFLGISSDTLHDEPVEELFRVVGSPYFDTLQENVSLLIGDFSDIEQALTQSFKYLKYYFPNYTAPPVMTAVTGFSTDLFITDRVIFIGLDFFAGEKAKYKSSLPNYISRRYTKEYIAPLLIKTLSGRFNVADTVNKTLLSEMIYHGKSYEFTKKILPQVEDSIIMGYNSENWENFRANESFIWSHFIENNLLFSTDHFEIEKYIGERPYTAQIGPNCPGRIGQRIGWEIVKKYLQNNPEISLSELMNESNTQKIFEGSKYRPNSVNK